jgi:prepilin-type N-terminal cleavage/methylation domain-containing protein
MHKQPKGFTLVELLIVVVIMAVLAATVIPEFSSSTVDAQQNTAVFNLQTLRSQIQTFRAQHGGSPPATLEKLTVLTDKAGLATGEPGVGTLLYGPYLTEIPEESITPSANVEPSAADPVIVIGKDGGWVYNATTGEIRINIAAHIGL